MNMATHKEREASLVERITQLEKENKELMYHANSLRCLKESAMEYKDADRYIQRKLKESDG